MLGPTIIPVISSTNNSCWSRSPATDVLLLAVSALLVMTMRLNRGDDSNDDISVDDSASFCRLLLLLEEEDDTYDNVGIDLGSSQTNASGFAALTIRLPSRAISIQDEDVGNDD